jgi:enoyl-CoA hydratase/carnithine racemase
VIPAEDLLAKTREYAEAVARGATISVGLIKLAVNRGAEMDIDNGLAYEREGLFRAFATEDSAEGIRAFVEKRPPAFKGR